jgi:hypothetical protein
MSENEDTDSGWYVHYQDQGRNVKSSLYRTQQEAIAAAKSYDRQRVMVLSIGRGMLLWDDIQGM